ncbi:sulfotransferase family 2 domain-containing protein [Puniceibacterium sediminis]|uniref:Sulfotransferase family protein n=1 Tax=Puniceibacterium sediminis TaxID=1608407 RepID=A0A238ZQS9_9RHOB|nr:sulfotransferase family 2 domain-containing protein [Puniceibacterium sediminis]SNR85502.1 Sulfotransferase family protein [Puniceibacterium sediminis]
MAKRLLYIHAPKCGGTSFGSSVRLAYFHSQATINVNRSRRIREAMYPNAEGPEKVLHEQAVRKIMLGDLMARGVQCISAHVLYHADLHMSLDPERQAVTLLRDPVARFMSHYAYVQRNHPDATRPDTLAVFLESEMAQRYGSIYLLYFAGTYQHTTDDLEGALATARENLGRFSLIGDLSRASAFRSALRNLVGRPLPGWERNKRPHGGKSSVEELPDTLRARIEALCAPDIALYRHAQSLPTCV